MMIAVGMAIRAVASARWSIAGTRLIAIGNDGTRCQSECAEIASHPAGGRADELDVKRLIETVLGTRRQVLLVGGLRCQHHLGWIADPVPEQEDEQQQADQDQNRMR